MNSYQFAGMRCRDHVLRLPLRHHAPDAGDISVFGREVVRPDRDGDDLPWLLYLQGGPGHKADRPEPQHAWLPRALDEFRVLLLDQRGTGRSTPVNRQTLAAMGTPADQADYLSCFRADAIVADAEAFRRHLVGEETPWTVLGQSFGGFCATTYLSHAPGSLREVLIAGGLPSLNARADDIYAAAYPRVRAKNAEFFARYPADAETARKIADHLAASDILLPTGDRLTVERFQMIGLELGFARQFDSVHFLLEEAFVSTTNGDELSDTFLADIASLTSFAKHPLFAVMHESIYAQGISTRWAAHRVRDEFPEFTVDAGSDDPVLFTGEMIYPWQFEQDTSLKPLAETADLLARREDWPALYDADQLAKNSVPVAAAVYANDMFVDRDMSLETASQIANCHVWLTNEYEHDGLRQGGVLDRLLRFARGLA